MLGRGEVVGLWAWEPQNKLRDLLSSQDAINRIQDLLTEGTLTGERMRAKPTDSPGLWG